MAQLLPIRSATCCCRRAIKFAWSRPSQQRSMVSLQVGPTERLNFPPQLPEQFLSQLPKRMRPGQEKRQIIIHESPPSEWKSCKDPVKNVDQQQMAMLDPTGARARLFDPKNPEGAKAGDIILATFKTGEPFSGVAMSIKWRGPHTSVLLRNQLTRVGTEMNIKVFSPLVQSMEVAQKAAKRPRRARLYYLRKPKHDMGSVQKIVDGYLRQRAILTGASPGGAKRKQGGVRGGVRGGARR
ncbi:hypothetical protein OHC33_008844 [Knufia fluminis]|uniref:Ribosomal protein L19 n=1 Tax=Knufia fluminis TaxID=191047 RepID=A0AAN8E9W6_9EURO|nr:hypothetical protein OHC33_008844 [Knufia fluminis]